MPVSTVGPAKAYSSLQAWAEDKYVNAGQEDAECYAGSDLGGIALPDPWGPSITTIYAAPGNMHPGTWSGVATDAAVMGGNIVDFFAFADFTIRGMRVYNAELNFLPWATGNNLLIEDCQFIITTNRSQAPIFASTVDSGGQNSGMTMTIRNNVFYWTGGTGTAPIHIRSEKSDIGTVACTATLQNNTIIVTGGTVGAGIQVTKMGGPTLSVTATNNLVLGSSACYSAFSFTPAGSYNLSSDATGSDWGATGAQINQTAASTVTDPAADARLKAGSAAFNNGTTIVAFADDILSVARPQNGVWDIGAFETFMVIASGRNRIISPTRIF